MPIFHDDCPRPVPIFHGDSPRPMPIFHEDPPAADLAGPYNEDCRSAQRAGNQVAFAEPAASMSAAAGLDERAGALDRVTLIERIKRQQPNNGYPAAEEPRQHSKSPLRRAEEDAPAPSSPESVQDNSTAGLTIERPRSALHAGDFRPERDAAHYASVSDNPALSTSPVAPWHHSFPASALPRLRAGDQSEARAHRIGFPFTESWHDRRPLRSRATSQSSLSSSFVLLPPTSPLVQQSNNPDLDFSPRPRSRQFSPSPERDNRRHTFSPQSLQTFHYAHNRIPTHSSRPLPSIKREGTYPYQAHQPRRSLASSLGHSNSTPQTPLLQPRRPSISSESPPLQHAPMVGSYEESILRGRMSTTPSRPLNFVAQIGVLGKGQCKPQLRCPPHVTLPFPAVFYSYNSGNGRIADSQPSPYVGLIDLENSLPPADDGSEARRKRHRRGSTHHDGDDAHHHHHHHTDEASADAQQRRRREKAKRRSTSPKSPPGGAYRIPAVGQLQIVIKNPNKTAVKLFLVPYDLSTMAPGQKTFIRQRSYSAGPIIDMPLSVRARHLGTGVPEASLAADVGEEEGVERPVLRYLVHLNVCCTGKGRYWLYKCVRVVFANRVPDGKERLRNEIQLPEPRYSAYKPQRDGEGAMRNTGAGTGTSAGPAAGAGGSAMSHAASLAQEKAFRRRSAGFSLGARAQDNAPGPFQFAQLHGIDFPSTMDLDTDDRHEHHDDDYSGAPSPSLRRGSGGGFQGQNQHLDQNHNQNQAPNHNYSQRGDVTTRRPPPAPIVAPIPFSLGGLATLESRPESREEGGERAASPWEKREFRSPTSPRAAGLLAQRLRGLDVKKDRDGERHEGC